MAYLNKISLNSNTYAVGTKINRLNLNGTIYDLGLDTSDGTATSDDICEDKIAYAMGKKIMGNIPSRNTVGKNDVLWLNKDNLSTGVIRSFSNVCYTKCQSNETLLAIPVPRGYYNGTSFVGCHINQLCADNTDTFAAIWGSYGELMAFALGISSVTSNGNWIMFRQNYTHQRNFRVFAISNIIVDVIIYKNNIEYKRVKTIYGESGVIYVDYSWEDTVQPNDMFRCAFDSAFGTITLFSWAINI